MFRECCWHLSKRGGVSLYHHLLLIILSTYDVCMHGLSMIMSYVIVIKINMPIHIKIIKIIVVIFINFILDKRSFARLGKQLCT